MKNKSVRERYNPAMRKGSSNKGAFLKRENIYKSVKYLDINTNTYRKIYFTLPFIDKITISGNAGIIGKDDKDHFVKNLNHLYFYNTDDVVTASRLYKKVLHRSGYENHFSIHLKNTDNYIDLWVKPLNSKARFLKLEFSMKKLGPKGFKELGDWFDENIIHMTFAGFISYPECIGRCEIAIDCIGLSFEEVIFDWTSLDKCVCYF